MKKIRTKNIRRLTCIAMACLVVFVCISSIFIQNAKSELYRERVMFVSEVANKNAKLINTKVEGYLSKLESIALIIVEHEEFDMEHAIGFLKKEASANEFKRMGIIAIDGEAKTSDDYTYDFSNRDYFVKAMQGESNVSNRLIDVIDSKAINVFATPIMKDNQVVSVLFATEELSSMANLLTIDDFDGRSSSYIIQSDGTPIIEIKDGEFKESEVNFFDRIKNNEDEKTKILQDNIAHGINGTTDFIENGVELQMSYRTIGINDWVMINVIPVATITKGSSDLINQMITIAIVLSIGVLVFGIYLVRHFEHNNKELLRIAYKDDLTDFFNWKGFTKTAEALLKDNLNHQYALVVLDISQFKVINDLFTQAKGSELLKHVALCIDAEANNTECFGHISADHFSLLLNYTSHQAMIERLTLITRNIQCFFDDYKIIVDFGIYIIDDEEINIERFNDRANISKKVARNNDVHYAFYDETIRRQILNEKNIENAMERGIVNKEFEVYLQPKISLDTGDVVSAEALVRWNHPEMGFIMPASFIPLFERNGFVKELDYYMFEEVCRILHKWKGEDHELSKITISVNLSRVHLNTFNLASDFLSIARKYHVNPEMIEIELTESALFEDMDKIIDMLNRIKEKGFKISIDDFGSGYSSLNTLKDLPVDTIKMDQGFLNDAVDSENSKIIIASIIGMIKKLSLKTLAEGVETKEEVLFLKKIGCDIAQGYYFGRPMKVEDFENYCIMNVYNSRLL